MSTPIHKIGLLLLLFSCLAGCRKKEAETAPTPPRSTIETKATKASPSTRPVLSPLSQSTPTRTYKVIHVFVVLCDNKHQGIVPVPAALGNGQNPRNNLYWGAMYGVKTWFKKQAAWEPVECSPSHPKTEILDHAAYKRNNTYIIAQAYDGACMKSGLLDFFHSAAGKYPCDFNIIDNDSSQTVQAGSMADMICFVGHNGLMDNQISFPTSAKNSKRPDSAVVLACKSDTYFSTPLKKLHCKPLITTSGFMAPEAYTLEAIIRSWSDNGDVTSIHKAAANAYSHYQKCSLKAAMKLFISYNTVE